MMNKPICSIICTIFAVFVFQENSYSQSRICNAAIGDLVSDNKIYVACVGDSITEGTTATDDFGYRKVLQDDIGILHFSLVGSQSDGTDSGIYSTKHEGISGDRSDEVESRLQAILDNYLSSTYKGILLLHVGTNDIAQSVAGQTAVDNVEDIIDIITAYNHNISVYVALIIPNINETKDTNTTQYNSLLSAMLNAYGKSNLYIVDMNTAFKANENWVVEYMSDDTHPNDAGYAVMAQTWYDALVEHGDA